MPRTPGVPAAPSGQSAAPKPKCRATTLRGAPCQAFAVADGFCISHDPARRDEARAARSKGAAVGNRLRAIVGRRDQLDSPAALVRFTSGVVQDVLGGVLTPDVARVALYGISIQRTLVESSDLERRLAALEEAQTHHPKGVQTWQR
jgi:hypothetical protein